MIERPDEVAEKTINYILSRTLSNVDFFPVIIEKNLVAAVKRSIELQKTTKHSSSYRRGRVGDWRNEFTPEIKDLFKEHAGDWLVKLGYEKNNDW